MDIMIERIAFYTLAVVLVASGAGVVLLRNVMHSALALGLCLAAAAGIYASLGADFIFGAQLLVYVGGIAVLILFVVLLAGTSSDLSQRQTNRQWPAAALIGAAFLWCFAGAAGRFAHVTAVTAPAPTTRAIAALLLGNYAVPFEMTSLILLAAMVGAVIFGRRKAS